MVRFIDEVQVKISAGHGGKGSTSFRREKFIPFGGPDGGDGGRGGHVYFQSTTRLTTLQDLKMKRSYGAKNGQAGMGSQCTGASGEDLTIMVPVGTTLKDINTEEVLFDFTEENQIYLCCQGGRGGKGNLHFVSATNQAPKYSQPGEAGEFKDLKIELKMIAEAGIIGFPNAGKSTLISRISAAKPKIADYAFTTLVPNLGVVYLEEHKSFTIADIPGLIEGSHAGLGLGTRFLKHIERTEVLVHLIDGQTVLEDLTKPKTKLTHEEISERVCERYFAIRKELEFFNEALAKKPEILAVNKIELLEGQSELLSMIRKKLVQAIRKDRMEDARESEPFMISTFIGTGVEELKYAIGKEVFRIREKKQPVESVEPMTRDEIQEMLLHSS